MYVSYNIVVYYYQLLKYRLNRWSKNIVHIKNVWRKNVFFTLTRFPCTWPPSCTKPRQLTIHIVWKDADKIYWLFSVTLFFVIIYIFYFAWNKSLLFINYAIRSKTEDSFQWKTHSLTVLSCLEVALDKQENKCE